MSQNDSEGQLWKVSVVKEKPGTDTVKEFDQSISQAKELLEAYTQEDPIYTQESYEALVQALDEAEQVAANTNPNEGRNDGEAVRKALDALKAAVEGLVYLPSSQEKAELDEAIQDALKLDEGKYTAETYQAVKEALEAAQRVDRENRDEVLAAVEALNKALEALKEITDPGGSTDQPGGSTDQPGGSTDQPGGSTDQPGGSTDQPGGSVQQPGQPDTGNQNKPSEAQEVTNRDDWKQCDFHRKAGFCRLKEPEKGSDKVYKDEICEKRRVQRNCEKSGD